MGDWIDDVFDELDGRAVSETVRSRLWSLLDSAQLEDGEDERMAIVIADDNLSAEDASELMRQLMDCQPRVPEMYAPSQTALAKWIRSFCLLLV